MAAILCPRCHKLVSADAETCPHCGQRKPGLWGATAAMRRLGLQLNFPHLITVFCGVLYLLALALDPSAIFQTQGLMQILSPSIQASFKLGVTGTVPIFSYELWWTPITAIYLHGRPAAHLLQHDVGAPAWSGCRRALRPLPPLLRSSRSPASPAL